MVSHSCIHVHHIHTLRITQYPTTSIHKVFSHLLPSNHRFFCSFNNNHVGFSCLLPVLFSSCFNKNRLQHGHAQTHTAYNFYFSSRKSGSKFYHVILKSNNLLLSANFSHFLSYHKLHSSANVIFLPQDICFNQIHLSA